jgi:hypothetical protein
MRVRPGRRPMAETAQSRLRRNMTRNSAAGRLYVSGKIQARAAAPTDRTARARLCESLVERGEMAMVHRTSRRLRAGPAAKYQARTSAEPPPRRAGHCRSLQIVADSAGCPRPPARAPRRPPMTRTHDLPRRRPFPEAGFRQTAPDGGSHSVGIRGKCAASFVRVRNEFVACFRPIGLELPRLRERALHG